MPVMAFMVWLPVPRFQACHAGQSGYSSLVKTATITELKNRLSAFIDQVKGGETVLVLDRGRPVARLESAASPQTGGEGRLERLERHGILRRGSAGSTRSVLAAKPPATSKGASVVDALIAERRSSR